MMMVLVKLVVAEKERSLTCLLLKKRSIFFYSLASCKTAKPAVLSVVPGYCEKYIPSALNADLPQVLTDLYNPSYLALSYYDLLQHSSQIVLTVTKEQCNAVEAKTRDQSDCRPWFRFRAGRITASKFKSVCQSDPANPSLSLIMSICHADTVRLRTTATSWGCQHEKEALKLYSETSYHDQLQLSQSGVVISATHPYLGASPDGTVSCNCCELGICEVKVSLIVQNFVLIIFYFFSVHFVIRMMTWKLQPMM